MSQAPEVSCLTEVASQYGRYRYLLDGAPTAVEEHWSRKPRAGGGWFIRTERVATGVTLTVNAECEAGLVRQCQVEWLADGHEPVRAMYRNDNNGVSVVRQLGDEPPHSQVFSADEQGRLPLVLPLLRIFTGPVIKRLLNRGGEGDVLVPSIVDPQNYGTLLNPRLSQRWATLQSQGQEINLGGRNYLASCCAFTGDQYDDDTQFWLSEDETLLRYVWQQPGVGTWDVRLEELSVG